MKVVHPMLPIVGMLIDDEEKGKEKGRRVEQNEVRIRRGL
jgi:hypothetical protein